MEHGRRADDSMLGELRKNWILIAAVSGIIGTAAVNQSTLAQVEERTENHEERIQKIEQAIQAMEPMKNDIGDLKESNAEIQKDIKTILRAVK